MLDPKYIRENVDHVRTIINSGRTDPARADLDAWLALDEQRRSLSEQLSNVNASKNELAKLGRSGATPDEIREKGKSLKEESQKIESELREVETKWQAILDWIPNIPVSEDAMPFGAGESDNPVVKAWLPDEGYLDSDKLGKVDETAQYMPSRPVHEDSEGHTPLHHLDIGTVKGWIDNEQAGKVSGTRFSYLKGDLVLLQYAIQRLMFDELISRGFEPIIPPLIVKGRSLYSTSHFPEQVDQVYEIKTDYVEEKDPIYLVGSSEPSNFSYFMDRTLDGSSLPQKVFAYTPCFRSEAGSWGRDTKGIKRLHQFDKIEMNVVCRPDQSQEIFDELLSVNEWLLQQLQLPYHLVQKCTSDAGYHASAQQIDPEVWLGGQQEFMEVMTDTNTTDYQARRFNIKYKDSDGKKHFCHTLNDTGVAMGRMLIAIIDNYQQSDGSVKVPEVLQKYVGKDRI